MIEKLSLNFEKSRRTQEFQKTEDAQMFTFSKHKKTDSRN